MRFILRPLAIALLCTIVLFCFAPAANAFCGFFVAKSDAKLSNSASRVVITREGDRSVFLMANNYEGDVKDFARIVPIPVIPTRDQVRIGELETVNQLDTFTAPRLVLYKDDPCEEEYVLYAVISVITLVITLLVLAWVGYDISTGRTWRELARQIPNKVMVATLITFIAIIVASLIAPSFMNQANKSVNSIPDDSLTGVRVADKFTVGEYDVTILSADESDGLTSWLRNDGYVVPDSAVPMLQSYIQSGMKFFVVRVNLEEFQRQNFGFLRPIVIEYKSPRFMLPIRLGTLNANGADQDLIITILSPDGYVEAANYRTLTVPTDASSSRRPVSGEELPSLIRNQFSDFYNAVFQQEYERTGRRAVFLEYAGSTSKCDSCPDGSFGLLSETLSDAGVTLSYQSTQHDTYITRLHVPYNQRTFPKDLQFRIVDPKVLIERLRAENKSSQKAFYRGGVAFQARYVIRQASSSFCLAGRGYWRSRRHEMGNLQRLTGWSKE